MSKLVAAQQRRRSQELRDEMKEDVKESKKGEVDYKKVMQKASEELGTTEFSDQKINEIAEKLVNEKSQASVA